MNLATRVLPAAKETKATRTRRRILDSAAHELAMHGYDGTSLRQVAAGADLKLGSLYFHFSSKSELLTEVLRDAVDAVLDRIDTALGEMSSDASGADALAVAIDVNLLVLHESHDRGAAVVRVIDSSSVGSTEAAREHSRRYVDRWRDILAAAQRDGGIPEDADIPVMSQLIIGAMNSTVGRRRLKKAELTRIAATVKLLCLGSV
ncbi:MAG: TetR/AcrR family transcriptional regulator [Aeromicrobium sp.]|nr:TetR/AcrR family transcriptional regulator [Aeromicrobium sp.]